MNIGILGTGMVGNTIATRLVELGNIVLMGSRTKDNQKAIDWVNKAGNNATQGTFEDAAKHGEVIFNCTNGFGSIDALTMAGEANLNGKVVVDVSNPLDFTKGMPPTLFVTNTTSLAEQIQEKFHKAKVVKTLNTINCSLMVNPALLKEDHNIFISGNDQEAKDQTTSLLQTFGWKKENIIDLGDISTARGTEQFLPLWIRMMGTFKTPMFNIKIVKG